MARAVRTANTGVAALMLAGVPWKRLLSRRPESEVLCDTNHAMIGDNFEFKLGPPESGFSIFLAERTKKIHFIRHAEGFHNVATKKAGHNECLKRGNQPAQEHELWDARLTPAGIQQAVELRDYLALRPSGGRTFTAFDLVVVSPLTRTLQTADAIFGPARMPGVPAFLDPGQAPKGSPESEIASTCAVPRPCILVREECRERWGLYVCDGRRPIREIIQEFPGFDFSQLQYDEDCFYADERESDEHCCERGLLFLEWLNKRPEKCIAVVTHSSFLRHLFQQFGKDQGHDDKDALQRLAGNCELRSVVLCSHGVKDMHEIKPMVPEFPAQSPASTVDMNMIRKASAKLRPQTQQ